MSNEKLTTNTDKLLNETGLRPKDFFSNIKKELTLIDRFELKRYYAVSKKLYDKAELTGQTILMNRLSKKIKTLEIELLLEKKLDLNTYVMKDDIFKYINNVESRCVKIIELSKYQREIPDEIIDRYNASKGYFDEFLVLFTDYTGESAKQMSNELKDKDPILFGIFYDEVFEDACERFYYIGDWEDEYCDLTLDKMIMEFKEISDDEIIHYTKSNISNDKKDLSSVNNDD